MEGTLRCTLGSKAQQIHSLEDHTRSIQQSTSIHTKHFHNIQQQNNNHTQSYCKLFHQTIHTRQKDLLTEQQIKYKDVTSHSPQLRFKEAIKQSKNNNSQSPDKLKPDT